MNREGTAGLSVYRAAIIAVIMLQVIAAFYFCTRKQGFHYDEYYSYYSSNVSDGLVPGDGQWKTKDEISNEFMVLRGQGFNYPMVRLMQTYDVHPPVYYYVLHTVCSLTPGTFSKWQGLSVNLVFYLLGNILIWMIVGLLTSKDRLTSFFCVALYGFSPAVISGVVFIRMYVLLTFLCLLTVYIHIRALIRDRVDLKNLFIPVFILTFIGAGTHYYYIVFIFFTAAYMTLHLLFTYKDIKKTGLYALSVITGMILFLLSYPSALSHIFRSYRGTEARQAFFDIGNLYERAGLFVGILNEYLLPGMFYIMLLVILLIIVTAGYKNKRSKKVNDGITYAKRLIFVTVIGYFLVVYKTALTNAEEAVRYEMPVYGLMIIMMIIMIGPYVTDTDRNADKLVSTFKIILVSAALLMEIFALYKNKVVFLYEEDAVSVKWAEDHSKDTVIYIYNPVNSWMVWNDSMELMQYDRIFFLSMDNEEQISDRDIAGADELYVYAVRGEDAMKRIDELADSKGRQRSVEKVRELQYVDIFKIR